jgi:hypothetical protein
MKKLLFHLRFFWALALSGCAGTSLSTVVATGGTILGDLVTDVSAGAATYADVETVLGAGQQAIGAHGISIGNIGAYATASASSLNTSGLLNAAASLVSDITSQVANGASTASISAQLTEAQNSAAASIAAAN